MAEDGIITVPVNARHEWRRVENGGEELVVREWTDPEDGEKEVFFRNLNSVLLESQTPGSAMRGTGAHSSNFYHLLEFGQLACAFGLWERSACGKVD